MDASAASGRPPKPGGGPKAKGSSALMDPVLRNTLRYTVSAKEYDTLHKYVLSRSRLLRKRMPSATALERYMDGEKGASKQSRESSTSGQLTNKGETYNVRAVRHSLRVFVGVASALKAYEKVMARLKGKKDADPTQKNQPFYKSTALRLPFSLSTILLLYRLLFRFMHRLRAHLLDPSASPFRDRNPRTAATLTSPYAPAVGASLAGLALGVYPSSQLRMSVALLAIFRALEFGWDLCEGEGMIWGWRARPGGKGLVKRERPWWWGSWMLQPFAYGQLLHASVFDPECTPTGLIDFLWRSSTTYLHEAPKDLPLGLSWPDGWGVAGSLAEMARLKWPPFVSPTLFPDQPTLPPTLSAVAPLTAQAHPLITSLSCATLHPSDPSCLRTYLSFWARTFPLLGRYFLLFYSVLMLPRFKLLYNAPLELVNRLLSSTLRLTTFATGAVGTSWASICFFQQWFPRTLLPTQRFFLGGFLGGLWAYVQRQTGRGISTWSARTSVDSLWKVGVKRRWWKGMKGGDVWVFVVAMAIINVVYERDAKVIKDSTWRKGVSWIRDTEFQDWGMDEEEEGAQEEGVEEVVVQS